MRYEVNGGGIVELDVDPHDSVAEVRRLLGWDLLFVEGKPVDETRPVGTVWDGARLDPEAETVASPVVELVAICGLDAGSRWHLTTGRYRLWAPGEPELEVDEAGTVTLSLPSGSRRVPIGARDPLFAAGGTTWTVRQPDGRGESRPAPTGGRHTFNRPPRSIGSESHPPVELPGLLEDPEPRARFTVAMLAGPLLIGAVMAAAFRPMMALIALIGPVMLAVSIGEDRWRTHRQKRHNDALRRTALENLERNLAEVQTAEVGRRRSIHPDIIDVVATARTIGPALWERRPHHPDFLAISIGRGDVRKVPALADPSHGGADPASEAVVERSSILCDCPVTIDVRPGSMIGISGRRSWRVAMASAVIVRLSVHHGPADVRLAVVTDHPEDWHWCVWIPHTNADPLSDNRLFASTPDEFERVRPSLAPGTVVVLDHTDPAIAAGLARLAQVGDIAVLALAREATDLPGSCSTVVEVTHDRGRLVHTARPEDVSLFAADGVSADVAALVGRSLHGIDDPEAVDAAVRLPPAVAISGLLDPDETTSRWGELPAGLRATVGVTSSGPLTIDLVRDGPHMLVAGTTGSGKSEFLRSLIASLASAYPPDLLAFALIDYKGGSAFDACAGFPHVAGLVTDLDSHLSARALQSLRAEIRFREARLREAGAEDLDVYRLRCTDPLPRLVVVVDEYAALAGDLADSGTSLEDIARRGRSLGVHLVLATQRPAGVVGDSMRANINIRVAFRVQSAGESSDVLDDPIAARLPRQYPGRGFVRLGPGELIPFQAAHCTVSETGGDGPQRAVRHVRFGPQSAPPGTTDQANDGDVLRRMIDRATKAAQTLGSGTPRPPWAAPFPDDVELVDSVGGVLGKVDRPDRQQIEDLRWSPETGGLIAFGVPGSGTSGALLAAVAATAASRSQGDLQVYAIDGGGALSDLASWRCVGAVVELSDEQRIVRLLRHLHATLTERRRSATKEPVVLFVVDAVESVMAALDEHPDAFARELFIRTVIEGPSQGIVPVLSAGRPGSVPSSLVSSIPGRLFFRLADPMDYALVGRSARDLPNLGWGRGFDAGGRLIQIGRPAGRLLLDLVARDSGSPAPPPIEVLPDRVPLELIAAATLEGADERFVPIGLGDRDLGPVGFHLHPGDHVLIAGPPRSGRTTALRSIGSLAMAAGLEVVVLSRSGSSLEDQGAIVVDSPGELVDRARGRRVIAMIDDAERVDHPGITDLLDGEGPNVIAAGRADALRGMYRHWTREVRRCRLGISLRPQPDVDGELWQMQFPRRGPSFPQPGRGYLVSGGGVEIVQVAVS